jgi:hypothetical protein
MDNEVERPDKSGRFDLGGTERGRDIPGHRK